MWNMEEGLHDQIVMLIKRYLTLIGFDIIPPPKKFYKWNHHYIPDIYAERRPTIKKKVKRIGQPEYSIQSKSKIFTERIILEVVITNLEVQKTMKFSKDFSEDSQTFIRTIIACPNEDFIEVPYDNISRHIMISADEVPEYIDFFELRHLTD
jgi:hypothetical protein